MRSYALRGCARALTQRRELVQRRPLRAPSGVPDILHVPERESGAAERRYQDEQLPPRTSKGKTYQYQEAWPARTTEARVRCQGTSRKGAEAQRRRVVQVAT